MSGRFDKLSQFLAVRRSRPASNRMKYLIVPFFCVAAVLLVLPATSLALGYDESYKITTSLPGTDIVRGGSIKGITLASYIATLYRGALALVGLVAFIMIVYWGFIYVFAAGNTSKTADAKSGIFQAILGIILLLAGFLILQFINPDLANIQVLNNRLNDPNLIPNITNKPTTNTSQTPTPSNVPPQPGKPSELIYNVTSSGACADLGGKAFTPCKDYCLATPGLCSTSNVCCGKKP